MKPFYLCQVRKTILGFSILISGFLITAGRTAGQCFVDLQAVSVDPSVPGMAPNQTLQLVVVMRNNGPCTIPTGEAQLQITFNSQYLQPAVPFNFVDNCSPGRWSHVLTDNSAGQYNLFFRNNAGPIPPFGTFCSFQFNVGGTGLLSPGPIVITLVSTLTGSATSSDVDGSNQSASTQIMPIVLPLILSDFTASANSCKGILDWRTATEDNLSRFEIEYSTNGSSYTTVGTVAAKNSSSGSYYQFINDQGTSKGLYRLKMIDIDGKFSYSKVVMMETKCTGRKTLSMYPNPVAINQNLNVTASGFEGTVKGDLITISGQVIKTFNLKNGNNALAVEQIPQGTYLLRVTDGAGDRQSSKVVIMK